MDNAYVPPIQVLSPKRQWTLLTVLYDRGAEKIAVALGRWDGEPVLAMRWNGSDTNPIGNPQSRGLPTWFIVPNEFREPILDTLKALAPEKEHYVRDFFVDAIVLVNTIAMPDVRKLVQNAVLQGIGKRIHTETWTVRIFEPQSGPEYVIKLQGPNDFRWERTFFGPVEQAPNFIEQEVRKATQSS